MSVFDQLPQEIFRLIGMSLDCRSLRFFSRISQKLYQRLVSTDELIEVIRIILHQNTKLNLIDYTKEELVFLYRARNRQHMISAGSDHSLVLNSRGQVFGFGGNFNGQSGIKDNKGRFYPTLVEDPQFGQMTSISTGTFSSLVPPGPKEM
jgi:hypothetical protein